MQEHKIYMQRCLELAQMGKPKAFPNPLVGCVIVHKNKIIGEGYHRQFGCAHAEVNAIRSVKNQELLKSSTLYVSLEPCSHQGKTPPCAVRIAEVGIPEVVIAGTDPNPLVSGNGIAYLRSQGIQVTTGILSEEARNLNQPFFTFYEKKRPYIILKWAQTQDGFIARPNGDSKWISNKLARTLVHKWRSEVQAIMVGTNTLLTDDPALTTRLWEGKNPLRVCLDRKLKAPGSFKIFNDQAPTLIVNEIENKVLENIEFLKIDFDESLIPNILSTLFEKNIQSLFVEGGAHLLNQFMALNLWDEARVFTGDMLFNDGVKAPKIDSKPEIIKNIDNNTLKIIVNKHDKF